jgi:hypothetical protein
MQFTEGTNEIAIIEIVDCKSHYKRLQRICSCGTPATAVPGRWRRFSVVVTGVLEKF